jgi:hypothetical protein
MIYQENALVVEMLYPDSYNVKTSSISTSFVLKSLVTYEPFFSHFPPIFPPFFPDTR